VSSSKRGDTWHLVVGLGLIGLWCAAAWDVLSSERGQRVLLWLAAAMAVIVGGGALVGLWRLVAELWRRGRIQAASARLAVYVAVLVAAWAGSWLVAVLIGAPVWAVFLAAAVILSVRRR
jgi:hypothetical protein